MNKFSKLTRSVMALVVCLVMAFSFAACGTKPNQSGSSDGGAGESQAPEKNITIQMQLSKTSVAYGEEAVSVMVMTSGTDQGYDVLVKRVDGYADGIEYVEVDKNESGYTIKVSKNVPAETKVLVEAVAKEDRTKTDSKELTIKANTSADVSLTVESVNAKNGAAKPYIRKGDDVELKVDLTTQAADKTVSIKVENPSDMPNLVSVVEENGAYKVVVNEDVTENKNVKITVTSNANTKKTSSITIVVKPPKTGDKVGDLTQDAIDKLGNLKLRVSGSLSDVVTQDGDTTSTDYAFKTYLNANATKDVNENEIYSDYVFESAKWYSEWNVVGNKNVLANTYVRGTDGLTYKEYVDKNNKVAQSVVTDTYSNKLTWDSQRYWNHLGYLNLANFEQDVDNQNLYVYEMEYGTINYDPIMGTGTYTPTEDEYLMMYLAWSLTPMMEQQFYTFKVELDPETKQIVKLYGETYPNAIYDTDDEGAADKQIGVYYTKVEIDVEAYGDDIDMPEVTAYGEPTGAMAKARFEYLKNALSDLQNGDTSNYSFKMKATTTSAPSFDPDDYSTGSDSGDLPSSSATGKWDGLIKTKNYTSDSGETGYIGIVTEDGILINETNEYSNGGYHTEVYGYKQNDDNTYESFEYSGGLVGKSKKQGNISSILPKFDVSPYIFEFASMNTPEGSDKVIYSFALKDSVIIEEVAKEFCISDYARYASGSLSRSFTINISVDEEAGTAKLVGVTFAYNIIDTYTGYYETVYSDFGTSKLPEGIFADANYTPRVTPTSWNEFTNSEYLPAANTKWGDGEAMAAGDLMDKVFGVNKNGVAASASMPSPKVFADIFCDNFSQKIYHDWFSTGNLVGTEKEYKSKLDFNVWLDDSYVDSNGRLSVETYNEIIAKLDAEMAKCGFTTYEAGTYTTQSSDGSSVTRMKGYINDNAGANGMMIKVENIGYRTFYIEIYEKGDWNPSK